MWQTETVECAGNGQTVGTVTVQYAEACLPWPLPQSPASLTGAAMKAAVNHLPELAHAPLPWEFTVRVETEAESRRMNKSFRGKDYATNVLSFPSDEDDAIEDGAEQWYVGDLLICQPVLMREAAEQGKPLAEHFQHLVVHGLLHLLGYDHETGADDAARMESLEIAILADLNIENPYGEKGAYESGTLMAR